MKKLIATIITVALFSVSCATGGKLAGDTVSMNQAIAAATEELSAKVSEKTEIVIAAIKAPDSTVEDFITAELTTYLMNSGKFTVLERGDALRAMDAEKEFQLSGLVSDESALGIGHYLGAKVVVTGTFDLYNGFYQFRLRAVDVRTSQLLAITSSRIHSKDNLLVGVMPKNAKTQTIQGPVLDHLTRGKDLYREGKYNEAISELDEAIRLGPRNAEAYAVRADVYLYGKKDYIAAIADYNEAISLDRFIPEWYISRAHAYFYIDYEVDAAIAGLTQGIRVLPNVAELYNSRGSFYKYYDYDESLNDLSQAIRLNPNFLEAYFNRAQIYPMWPYENYDLAIADYTEIIRRAHKELDAYELAMAYNWRADIYSYHKGDYDKAIADYTEAIRFASIDKRNTGYIQHSILASLHISLGEAYEYKGDNDRSKAENEKAIAEYEMIITLCTEKLQLNPNDALIYKERGHAYYNLRDYSSAIADFETALKLGPDTYGDIQDLIESARQAQSYRR